MRGHHDMGGEPAGAVDRTEHANTLWEKRVDAMMMLLNSSQPPLFRVDEIRRTIEQLPPDAYDTMSYYERWIAGIAGMLVEKGVLSRAEIEARVAEVKARRGTAA